LSARWYCFFGFQIVCPQKLGDSRAGSSAVTVVVPVDFFGHGFLLFRKRSVESFCMSESINKLR
ncbi:MAG: hypothetical protein P8J22_00955, partial [Pseudomonadales bacterium]|nr:hypothetical protein [Pseudomonadales bacterium]